MRIRVAILDEDKNYLDRIVNAFNTKYADKIEIYSYTGVDSVLNNMEKIKFDVLVASDAFDVSPDDVPKECGFAYFVAGSDVSMINGKKAIGKYQKVDLIFKQILNLYADNALVVQGKGHINENVKVVSFVSFSGGTGSSTVAVAFAKRAAKQNKKVLYLNLEKMGSTDEFFQGEGQFTFSEVIYAVKSKKFNTKIKIESSIKKSKDNVYFFSSPKVSLDMLELKPEEIDEILSIMIGELDFEYVVIDYNFNFDIISETVWNKSDQVIVISDGEETSNVKFSRACAAISLMNQHKEKFSLKKASVLYNRFSSKSSKKVIGVDINEMGGIPKYSQATNEQVINQIESMVVLDSIL